MSTDPVPDSRRLLAEARRAFQSGHPDLAKAMLRQVLAISPDNAQPHLALGIIALAEGDSTAAIRHMREALRYDPRLPAAIEWLAVLYLQSGDIELAEKYARRGLASNLENNRCLKVVGQCHVSRAEYPEALDFFDRAVRCHPDDAEAHFAKGSILRRLNRETEALAELQEAIRISPHLDCLVEVAELSLQTGRLEEAVDVSHQALGLDANSYRANVAMARALTELERLDEAAAYWAVAEAREPAPGALRLEMASAFIRTGRFDDAQRQVQNAIDVNPESGGPYYMLFSSRRVTTDDQPLIERIERRLQNSAVDGDDRVNMLYALGKAYDNLGNYREAMAKFNEANALQLPLCQPFDRDAFRRGVDNQIETFSKPALKASGPGSGDFAACLPLFVLGMMRSGTTLADQILSCHPEVGGAGEQGFWLDHEGDVVNYARRRVDYAAADRLRPEYLGLLTSLAPGFRFVIDKNPANLLVAGLLHRIFPASPIVCTRRHAVDTALSIWMTHMRTAAPFMHDQEAITFAYKECLRLMDHWRDAMPADRYLEVRYESLIDDPEAYTRKMVEFCRLPWDPACLHPELNKRSIRTPSFWQARQPVYRTSVDRWKNYEPYLGAFQDLVGRY